MADKLCSHIFSHDTYLASLASLSHREIDAAKAFSSQIAIKGYFAGEAAGIRLANRES
jgi:phosphatidylinositol 4-kinase